MEKPDCILIVDDDPEIRRLLVDYLARNAYEAIAARDGREMWRLLERHVVDLIVLDLMLPDTDGLTLCRDLRASGSGAKSRTANLPVLMLTARGEETDRIVTWLDSVCQFYGVYEKEGGEAQLAGGLARPTLE